MKQVLEKLRKGYTEEEVLLAVSEKEACQYLQEVYQVPERNARVFAIYGKKDEKGL